MDHKSSTQAPFLEALERAHLTALGAFQKGLPAGFPVVNLGEEGLPPSVCWVKKEITEEEKPAGQAKQNRPFPPLALGLDLPLLPSQVLDAPSRQTYLKAKFSLMQN